jgi:hypothetical protein
MSKSLRSVAIALTILALGCAGCTAGRSDPSVESAPGGTAQSELSLPVRGDLVKPLAGIGPTQVATSFVINGPEAQLYFVCRGGESASVEFPPLGSISGVACDGITNSAPLLSSRQPMRVSITIDVEPDSEWRLTVASGDGESAVSSGS